LIIFHLMEILGATIVGRFLDDDDNDKRYTRNRTLGKRTRAKLCLGSFLVINSIGNIIAAHEEFVAKTSLLPTAHDISNMAVALPSIAFVCWGFADAQIQVYSYWLIGECYKSGHDHARAVGFYKLVQSLGTSIGFYLIPVSRLTELMQLMCSSMVFATGSLMAFTQLPSGFV